MFTANTLRRGLAVSTSRNSVFSYRNYSSRGNGQQNINSNDKVSVPSSLWKTALFGIPLLAAAPIAYDKYKNKDQQSNKIPTDDNNLPGEARSASTRLLDASTYMLQSKSPVKSITTHICGIDIQSDDPSKVVPAHYYMARLSEDFSQGILYDSDRPDAKLIGVKFIISEKLYNSLPAEEKKMWSPNTYGVASGTLVAPEIPSSLELKLMEQLAPTYGKTFAFWSDQDPLPYGNPRLLAAPTREGMINPSLLRRRDDELGVSNEFERKYRANINYPSSFQYDRVISKDRAKSDMMEHPHEEGIIERATHGITDAVSGISGVAMKTGHVLMDKGSEILHHTKEVIVGESKDIKEDAKRKGEDLKNTAYKKGEEARDSMMRKGEEIKDSAARKTEDLRNSAMKKEKEMEGKAHSMKDTIVHKGAEIKDNIMHKGSEIKDSIQSAEKGIENRLKGAKDTVTHKGQELKDTMLHKGEEVLRKDALHKRAEDKAARGSTGSNDSLGTQTKESIKQTAQAFKDDGSIGSKFTEKGSIGGTIDKKVGGPFSADGAIGKQFTTEGVIGGTGQKVAEKVEQAVDTGKSGSSSSIGRSSSSSTKGDSTGSSTKEAVKHTAQAFKDDGSIGSKFTEKGSIGGTIDKKVGGPFSADGAIGKQFTTEGVIGGTGQKVAEKVEHALDTGKSGSSSNTGRSSSSMKGDSTGSSTKEAVKHTAQAFKEDGSIGSKFTEKGSIGGTIDKKVGGPFSADGAIGKQFTTEGVIGGTGQKVAEKVEQAVDTGKSGSSSSIGRSSSSTSRPASDLERDALSPLKDESLLSYGIETSKQAMTTGKPSSTGKAAPSSSYEGKSQVDANITTIRGGEVGWLPTGPKMDIAYNVLRGKEGPTTVGGNSGTTSTSVPGTTSVGNEPTVNAPAPWYRRS